jgi:hypothetical protein
MAIEGNPIRPLQRSLQSVFRRLADPRLLAPFLFLATGKALLLTGAARFDLLPAHCMAVVLWMFPQGVELLHYPQTLHNLPEISRWLDRLIFVSLGAVLHGWGILYLARLWTQLPLRLFPNLLTGIRRVVALACIATLVLAIPYATHFVTERFDVPFATVAVLLVGFLVQMFLFVAPAFLVIEGRSLWQSLRLSVGVVVDYPIAMPLVIVVLSLLHAPILALRMPGLFRGVGPDPDWILYALLAQIPVDLIGALLAAGLAARLALTSRSQKRAT